MYRSKLLRDCKIQVNYHHSQSSSQASVQHTQCHWRLSMSLVTWDLLHIKNHSSLKKSSLMILPDMGSWLNLQGNMHNIGGRKGINRKSDKKHFSASLNTKSSMQAVLPTGYSPSVHWDVSATCQLVWVSGQGLTDPVVKPKLLHNLQDWKKKKTRTNDF